MVSVCQICKEPIWNFFCSDCLADDIKHSLPGGLQTGFASFHRQFTGYFHSNLDTTFNWCLNCKTLKEASICPYCYGNEVVYWLKAHSPGLAKRIIRLLPWDFGRVKTEAPVNPDIEPIDTEVKRTQFGICDGCGEYSDGLESKEGEWLCEDCRD